MARQTHPAVAAVVSPLITANLVARCGIFELEALFSARGWRQLENLRRKMAEGLPLAETSQADFDRAAEVMGLLAQAGLHHAVPVPDLILAAIAERHGLVVLHYDQDFDQIAQVTGQRTKWVVPQGSVP